MLKRGYRKQYRKKGWKKKRNQSLASGRDISPSWRKTDLEDLKKAWRQDGISVRPDGKQTGEHWKMACRQDGNPTVLTCTRSHPSGIPSWRASRRSENWKSYILPIRQDALMTVLTEVRQNVYQVLTRQDGKPSVLTLGFVIDFCIYPVSIYFGIPLFI